MSGPSLKLVSITDGCMIYFKSKCKCTVQPRKSINNSIQLFNLSSRTTTHLSSKTQVRTTLYVYSYWSPIVSIVVQLYSDLLYFTDTSEKTSETGECQRTMSTNWLQKSWTSTILSKFDIFSSYFFFKLKTTLFVKVWEILYWDITLFPGG